MVKGKVTDKYGKPVPFSPVRIYELENEKWVGDNTDIDGNYEVFIFPVNPEGEYNLYAGSSVLEQSTSKTLTNLKISDRKKINFELEEIPKIKGKILNLDNKGRQFGVIVEAIGVLNGEEDIRQRHTRQSDLEGEFEFLNLPKSHQYHIRVHGGENFIYVKNDDGR